MQDFRNLRIWHLAQALALDVARALSVRSRQMPGLRAQAVRAATSVASNIAEGCGKRAAAEFLRFLEMALGSLLELESELDLARKAEMLSAENSRHLGRSTATLRRMLVSFMSRVQARIPAVRS